MGTLYIIGNGFDLHFNLKTRPENFIEYLKKQPVYNEVSNALDVLECYGVDWNEYEQSLNDINLDELEFQNEIQPDYLSDRESDRDGGIVNMQMYVDGLSDAIKSALEQMVNDANNDAFELSNSNTKKQLFRVGDAILTFNYTSTIEYLFDVPYAVPILHIHGCYEHNSELIFGYRSNQNSYTETWTDIDEDHWDYYVAQQKEIVYSFYDGWRKQLQISKLRAFLSECNGIDSVVVLGHSMSAVDAEYMEEIERTLRPARWEISYYSDFDDVLMNIKQYTFRPKIHLFNW